MQTWIKFADPGQLVEGQLYFLGKHYNKGDPYHENCSLVGRGLNGEVRMTSKPGIAIRFTVTEALAAMLRNPGLVPIEIPADADRRWKARQRRFN